MSPPDSPPPPRRVRLSFLAPALISRFDGMGRLKRGLVVGFAGPGARPVVLWDDDDAAFPAPVPPDWLELAND